MPNACSPLLRLDGDCSTTFTSGLCNLLGVPEHFLCSVVWLRCWVRESVRGGWQTVGRWRCASDHDQETGHHKSLGILIYRCTCTAGDLLLFSCHEQPPTSLIATETREGGERCETVCSLEEDREKECPTLVCALFAADWRLRDEITAPNHRLCGDSNKTAGSPQDTAVWSGVVRLQGRKEDPSYKRADVVSWPIFDTAPCG